VYLISDVPGMCCSYALAICMYRRYRYRNLGEGEFGEQQVLFGHALGASSVYAADLDGDGDNDVLFCARLQDNVAW